MSTPFNASTSVPNLKITPPTNTKCSSIRRFSLNFYCKPDVYLPVLPASLLSSLCNIEALDLSCLELEEFANLNEVEMLRTQATDKNAKETIFVNLSQNRIKDQKSIINKFDELPVMVEVVMDKTEDPFDVQNIVLSSSQAQ